MLLLNGICIFQCVRKEESVSELAEKMLSCDHSGFPVVNDENQLIGSITRRILAVILEYHFYQNREKVRSYLVYNGHCESLDTLLHGAAIVD